MVKVWTGPLGEGSEEGTANYTWGVGRGPFKNKVQEREMETERTLRKALHSFI